MEKEKIVEKIVNEIVSDLNDRRGCGIDGFDDEVQNEIKESWKNIVLENIQELAEKAWKYDELSK